MLWLVPSRQYGLVLSYCYEERHAHLRGVMVFFLFFLINLSSLKRLYLQPLELYLLKRTFACFSFSLMPYSLPSSSNLSSMDGGHVPP